MKTIQDTAQNHAPVVEATCRNKKKPIPWFSAELKAKIKEKNELLMDYYQSGIKSYKDRIKALGNKITQQKRNLKQEYIAEKMEEAGRDSNKCWKLLNAVTNRLKVLETTEPDMMTQEKANKHNNFFATIGLEIQKKLAQTAPPTQEQPVQNEAPEIKPMFSFKAETQKNIEKLIDNIRSDVAVGDDMIGARLIKDIKNTVSPVLTKIINKGYETNTFPNIMKKAVIKALHKKGNTDDISNYRPISILPTLSKTFERAAVNQLISYLEENKLLSPNQHAYRKNHSTVTCLVEAINYIYKLIDNKKYAAVASLDLSKAFDSISHKLILKKLRNLGLKESAVQWTSSYLKERKQVTKFKYYTSQEETVSSGIPQGSIIGPLLFLCYTNDIHEVFKNECRVVAYADDMQIILEARTLPQLKKKIENAIVLAQKWYQQNSMKNNISKTEILVVNRSQKNEFLKIDVVDEGKQISIESKTYIKVLGVLIDNNLNWRKQVIEVKRKAMNITRNIHRINHLLPTKHRVNLYNAIISPQFSYADIVWGGCGKKESLSLQRVQNFAAKSITGNRKYDSATESLRKLKFLNLEQRRNIHETVFIHKALIERNTENINKEYKEFIPTTNTRFANLGKLKPPSHKTAKFERSPLYRTISAWNNCPNSIPTENIKQHKSQLQKHLIAQI